MNLHHHHQQQHQQHHHYQQQHHHQQQQHHHQQHHHHQQQQHQQQQNRIGVTFVEVQSSQTVPSFLLLIAFTALEQVVTKWVQKFGLVMPI